MASGSSTHHEFRAETQQWWKTAQAAMAPGGGWDEAVAKNLEAGFYNHSFCPVGPEGYLLHLGNRSYSGEFQEFIDGPNGVNFGLGAWMNICREINVEMAGNPPYQGSSESPHGRAAPAPAFSLGNKMPGFVSIHAESTGVTSVFGMRLVLEGSGAGRGPMSAATAGSVCLSENDCSSAHRRRAASRACSLDRLPGLDGVMPEHPPLDHLDGCRSRTDGCSCRRSADGSRRRTTGAKRSAGMFSGCCSPFWRRYINPRCFCEGMASAPMKTASRRNKAASFLAADLFTGANAEPFQYNVVITAPAKSKPPFHGLD